MPAVITHIPGEPIKFSKLGLPLSIACALAVKLINSAITTVKRPDILNLLFIFFVLTIIIKISCQNFAAAFGAYVLK